MINIMCSLMVKYRNHNINERKKAVMSSYLKYFNYNFTNFAFCFIVKKDMFGISLIKEEISQVYIYYK